jgi:alkylation response protein AidB-like acyl-CoA dehydrogenase
MAYQASRMSLRDYQIEIYLQVWPGATPLLPLARTCGKARMGAARPLRMAVGADGYTQDFLVDRMMYDAKIIQIYEGTSPIQRVVMERSLLG